MLLLGYTLSTLAYTSSEPLSEEAYIKAVNKIMLQYEQDPALALRQLSQLDTQLLCAPKKVSYSSNGDIVPYGASPTDYELTVHSFRRGNSRNYYLDACIEAKKTEIAPGPLDKISIEWDTKYADYYVSNGDSNISSVADRKTGIVLFNIEDKKLKKGEFATCIVQVTPKQSNVWLEFGSKYVHNYTTVILLNGEASYSFAPSSSLSSSGEASLGLTYTYGFKMTFGASTKGWQLWADNAVYL